MYYRCMLGRLLQGLASPGGLYTQATVRQSGLRFFLPHYFFPILLFLACPLPLFLCLTFARTQLIALIDCLQELLDEFTFSLAYWKATLFWLRSDVKLNTIIIIIIIIIIRSLLHHSTLRSWGSPLRVLGTSLVHDPPGGSGWIISVGDYADNSFAALGSSDPIVKLGSSPS